MRKSSASGMGMAQGLSEIQLVNGFHQTVESQSAIRLNGAGHDQAHAPHVARPEAFSSIVRASRAMDEIINKIKRERDCEAPMLITGETGVGKELIARAVHAVSSRHTGEFIPFNCGGATPELIASELFGYRRGAFTGADKDYTGVIRAANGGTLLLDEIGELPLAAQPRLLRFLQEGEVHPLGEARPINANVRVIAATNRDLEADVREGRFRDDLFWRLNVLCVHIPPLRERREDIRPLAEHFLRQCLQETGKQGLQLSDEAWALLLDHHWPGNVRQLAAVAHRLTALAANGESIGREIALAAIGTGIFAPPPAAMVGDNFIIDSSLSYHERLEELERQSIIRALNETGDNITQAAKTLGMSRNGLKNVIERLGIKITTHD